MLGNASEWCSDWYDARYYADSPSVDPRGPPWVPSIVRVVRGGAWSDRTRSVRCACRYVGAAVLRFSDAAIGFRVAASLPSK